MRVLQVIEIPRAAQQINIKHLHVGPVLFDFLYIEHWGHDLPVLRQQQSIGRDRAEQIFNIIVRNKVMAAVVERPVGRERCR